MFEYLASDNITIIFSYLSQYELLNILLTNKLMYNQILKYINTTKFININTNKSLEIAYDNNLYISIIQVKKILDWDRMLIKAAGDNDLIMIKLMIKYGANKWHKSLLNACFYGDIDTVKFFVKKGADNWNEGLIFACSGGHMPIVKYMLKCGARDYSSAFVNACLSGDMDIIKLMIKRGAKFKDNDIIQQALYNACFGGNMDVVNFLMNNGAKLCPHTFCGACENNHIDIIQLHLKNNIYDWNKGFYAACKGGNESVVKLIIDKCGENALYFGLIEAIKYNNLDIAKILIEKINSISSLSHHEYNNLLYSAIIEKNIDGVKLLINSFNKHHQYFLNGTNGYLFTYHELLSYTCYYKSYEIMHFFQTFMVNNIICPRCAKKINKHIIEDD